MGQLLFLDDAAARAQRRPDPPEANDDVLPALAVTWLASALRVAGGLWLHQPFGVELTLALAAVIVIPLAALPRWARDRPAASLRDKPGP